ncbi:MAG: Nramp family divalent metal transporter [Planctomycetaceae bacterium]
MTEDAGRPTTEAPYPGSKEMPQWNVGELIDAPKFKLRNWFAMLGPGLLMGGAAIGGGEWLVGPIVTAKYGGAMLWLATLSVIGQVIYNIEISRYTLYSGEPIFTGKFRTLFGPTVWVFIYLLLDFGSVFPYLAASAATPLATVMLGEVPDPAAGKTAELLGMTMTHETLLRVLAYVIFLTAMIPLIFGGKIYNALKALMTFKIVSVFSFLIILAIGWSTLDTWGEIFSGFFKFGNVPIRSVEDVNGNGKLDVGEDWDGDKQLDVMEPSLKLKFDTVFRKPYATDIDQNGKPDPMVNRGTEEKPIWWPDLNEDGKPDDEVTIDVTGDGKPDGTWKLEMDAKNRIRFKSKTGKLLNFIDVDNDGTRDGDRVTNVFTAGEMPDIDWSLIAFLSALVAISGSGGLSNAPISNYTRDQGWGMGHHVGAIPSVVGGQNIQLSHEGTVFIPDEKSLPRWKRWYRHVLRDQLVVWMPACFLGLALPSMLSVQFLPRGTEADKWTAAAMTAGAVQDAVGDTLGPLFWFMTLFCGFLVLAPSMATSADGIIRRWVDVFWTSSKRLRQVDPKNIRYIYFGVLTVFVIFGLIMLSLEKPTGLLTIATMFFNFALGFSCLHTVLVNVTLMPKELRPNWFLRISLSLGGLFFLAVATVATMQKFGAI